MGLFYGREGEEQTAPPPRYDHNKNQLVAAHTISRVKGDQSSKVLYERLKDKYRSHLGKSIRKRDLQMLNSDDNKSK
ncbi:hypothetical protein HHI36_020469, partial [Cryptolaemus montrouzieri]